MKIMRKFVAMNYSGTLKFIGIIPARYASSRFPGKPLVSIRGKSMIQRVYEQAQQSSLLARVVVATDDMRIAEHVENFGGHVTLTSPAHQSGTDRCAEAAEKDGMRGDVIINIQGDEPFIHPEQIDRVASCFSSPEVQIATLVKKIDKTEELQNPNIPKVILDNSMQAIYFSRTPIPYLRGKEHGDWVKEHTYYKHIGIYAYRMDVLRSITRLAPSSLETAEALEQLRWMENGYKIHVTTTHLESRAVDTPADLEFINNLGA